MSLQIHWNCQTKQNWITKLLLQKKTFCHFYFFANSIASISKIRGKNLLCHFSLGSKNLLGSLDQQLLVHIRCWVRIWALTASMTVVLKVVFHDVIWSISGAEKVWAIELLAPSSYSRHWESATKFLRQVSAFAPLKDTRVGSFCSVLTPFVSWKTTLWNKCYRRKIFVLFTNLVGTSLVSNYSFPTPGPGKGCIF